jgi:toxin ParE1/3/4
MADVVWTDEAFEQVEEIVAYIEASNLRAAADMGDRLFALGESLAVSLHRGRPVGNAIRELVTVRPYILRYTVRSDVVMILNVRHSRRRPLR